MDKQQIFAYNLKKLRKDKGLTQKELADMLKVSDKNLSKWECGRSVPDIFYLQELSRIFEVSIDDFFVDSEIEEEKALPVSMTRDRRLAWIWFSLIMLVNVLIVFTVVVAKVCMPETIPAHYNAAGEIDRWGSSNEFLVMGIVFSLISLCSAAIFVNFEKYNCNARTQINIIGIVFLCWQIFSIIMLIIIAVKNNHYALQAGYLPNEENKSNYIVIASVLVVYALCGMACIMVKKNDIIGVRLPITFNSEYAWNILNRLGGMVLIALSYVLLMLVPFVKINIVMICIYSLLPCVIVVVAVLIGAKAIRKNVEKYQ